MRIKIAICGLFILMFTSCPAVIENKGIAGDIENSDTVYAKDRTIPNEVTQDSDITDTGDTSKNIDTAGPADCRPCVSTADCAKGYDCIPLATGNACLKRCTEHSDCISGYLCYTASTEGKNCVPPSYKCVKCAFEGCPEGKVCNINSGACVDKTGLCGQCDADWECGPGNRCYHQLAKIKGVCEPECKTVSDCPQPRDKYSCRENKHGVRICQPWSPETCCPTDKPDMLDDGTCVECVNAEECKDNEVCNNTDHKCEPGTCGPGENFCSTDHRCHECCETTDCPKGRYCLNHVCTDNACTNPGENWCPDDNMCHPCCDNTDCPEDEICVNHYCEWPVIQNCDCGGCEEAYYPYCVSYYGKCVCAECDPKIKDSCRGDLICDAQDFYCKHLKLPPTPTPPPCYNNSDCIGPNGTEDLKCSKKGFCYNTDGSCDNKAYGCDTFSGSRCFDVMTLLFGDTGGVPGMPQGAPMMGVCTCTDGAKCPDNGKCYSLETICAIKDYGQLLCPDGKLPQKAPKYICRDPSSLISGGGI